jgi:plastocyanin
MIYVQKLFVAATLLLLIACSSTPEPLNITLLATDIAYDADNISAAVGQTVNVEFVNNGALEHNFIIDEFGIDNLLQSGESSTISFTLEKAGSYEYYCNVAGHLEAGMKGTITVSE